MTILFTDLVDSTVSAAGLSPADADRWRDSHFALLRGPLTDHDGREVKTLGDGLMVVFDSAAQAIDAAVTMQQSVERANRGATLPAQSVRIGISLGEAMEEDGDYFGDPVVEAARLCAAADGGQVLLTRLVELTAGRRTEQRVVGLGPRILKGFEEPVEVAEVRWEPAADDSTAFVVPMPARCLVEPPTGFVGRRQQTALLADALKEVAASGHRQVVMIGGEPGMGKTTLATTFAREAHTGGAIVLLGHADEELGLPYQVWVEVLHHLMEHAPPTMLEVFDAHREALARILPLSGLTASEDGSNPESARYALFEAVRSVLTAASEVAPLVLVLDDLQWADAPSLALLRHFISAPEPLRALLVGTFRDSDAVAGCPLTDLLAALHREAEAQRVSLRGLDESELMSLMTAASGHDLDEDGIALRDALLSETDGNPFFIGELLRHLVETRAIYVEGGRWVASTDLRTYGLPVSVHEVIGRRLGTLGEPAVRVLEAAAVIGREFDVSTLVAATGTREDDVLDVLDAGTAARVLVNVSPERYMFAHALVEHSLYDAITPTRRARLHRHIAEAIEDHGETERELRVAELALHWFKATTPQDADKAIHYAMAAGDRALAQLAADEGVRWYSQALDLIDQRGSADRRQRAAILAGLGVAQRNTGAPAYRETLLDAARIANEIGDTDLLVTAVLTNTRGFQNSTGAVDQERVDMLNAALDAVPNDDSPERAMLLALLGSELLYVEPYEQRRQRFDEAMRMVRASGDDRALASVISTGILCIDVPPTLAERRELLEEARAAARRTGDLLLQFWADNFAVYTLMQAGELDAADALAEWTTELAERMSSPILRWVCGYARATMQIARGDFAVAERTAETAIEIGRLTGQPDSELFYLAQLSSLAILQGTAADEHVDLLLAAAEMSPALQATRVSAASMLCGTGKDDLAVEAIAPLLDGRLELHYDMLWLGMTILTAEVCCHLGLREAAATVYDSLLPVAGNFDNSGVETWGCSDDALGLLADFLGRGEAASHYEAALAIFNRAGARYFATRTRIRYGSHLLRQASSPSDRERGLVLVQEGLTRAQEEGYALLENLARSALAV